MRIVFVIVQLANGGAERALTTFANALAKMGEDVHIVCLEDAEDDYTVDANVKRHLLQASADSKSKRSVFSVIAAVRQLRNLSGDVIIPFCPPYSFYCCIHFAVLFSKTKMIYTVRNNRKNIPNKRQELLSRISSYLADGIWVQTQEQCRFFPKFMHKKIFAVRNMIDDRFLHILRTDRDKICHFINVGRLHPQKNQKMLIRAFERMVKRTGDEDATLTIYGKSGVDYAETETELKDLISRSHLEGRVFLPGRVSDIETRYAQADAFVLSSNYEGCPNALMEAMAAGLPCISTDCPTGPSMLIENGKNGLLVPVEDEKALSYAMESMIMNPQSANFMGMTAKQSMKEWESAEELAKQLMVHLRRICS